ncbi:MAG: sulfatase [Myxococcota bacterium]
MLVTIDTLRADHVGCYSAGRAHTPTLDRIAAEGVRFAAAISPAPLTLPSHASLMTALDPPRHGVRNNSTFRLSDDVDTLAERMRARGLATGAFIAAVVLDRQYGLARGFDHYDDQMSLRYAAGESSFPERRAERVVDAALEWLETAPDRFFLWMHLYDPHANYDPPPGFAAAFLDDPYAGEIAYADFQLGRLLDEVRRRWPDERSLVVVTSDHGESRGEHSEISHSLTVYDATQHVPLLMSGPGVPRGRLVEELVRIVDVAPTILALLDFEPLLEVDGLDLRPTLRGHLTTPQLAYVETLSTQLDFGWSPLLGLRSARFKYIRAPRPELYDLLDDPRETQNLASERPDIVDELDHQLELRLARGRKVEPNLTPTAQERAQLLELGYVVSTGQLDEEELGRVGGIDPKDGLSQVSVMLRAVSLIEEDQAPAALELLDPIDAGGWMMDFYRAEAAREAGDLRGAEAFARAAIAADRGRVEGHLSLGRALETQGRFEAARAAFEAAEALDAAGSEALVGLGRIAETREDLKRAEALYEEAAARRGAKGEAVWRLAALRIESGRDAAELLDRLPAAARLRPRMTLRLARAEQSAGLHERARERLERALKRKPQSGELRAALEGLENDR